MIGGVFSARRHESAPFQTSHNSPLNPRETRTMTSHNSNSSRRSFLKTSAAVTGGYWLGSAGPTRAASPNEKLNVACIGVGGRGSANVGGVSGENIVAMCDVDEKKAGGRFQQFDKAKKFQDFRVMLDKLEKQIDAVVISTPDHTHFHPARQAMLMGKHVLL